MHFWIILIKVNGDKWFRPARWNSTLEVYTTKAQASAKLREAKIVFGSKNAYLQKLGAIS